MCDVFLGVCLSVCLKFLASLCVSGCMSVCVSICVCLSVCLCVCPYVFLSFLSISFPSCYPLCISIDIFLLFPAWMTISCVSTLFYMFTLSVLSVCMSTYLQIELMKLQTAQVEEMTDSAELEEAQEINSLQFDRYFRKAWKIIKKIFY